MKGEQLDFTVFGVARSGTTALARAINLHPDVYCAVEAIKPDRDVSNLRFPGAFIDPGVVGSKLERQRESLNNNRAASIFGNKYPRYFLYLNAHLKKNKSLKNIGIYRENFDFVYSWNKRVETMRGWNPGRVGLVGIIECILFMRCTFLSDSSENYLFSFNRLFKDDADHCQNLYNILADSPTDVVNDFRNRFFSVDSVHAKVRKKSSCEALAESYFSISEFDDLIRDRSGMLTKDFSREANKYVSGAVMNIPGFLTEVVSDLSEDSVSYLESQLPVFKSFLPEAFKEMRRILKGVRGKKYWFF